ncbi:MAG: electron transfer flavoprotein subunit beta/FixA family protein, partial [Deltaproteobacteria bacterium]|nr:electron transfer flavoprotein subunit beta/FixA family protein [Deltaproteobacteria bacterium]
MHIIVCIKQVPDPEGPRDSFEINEALNQVQPIGIPPVLSLFDENALEAALRIKDTGGQDVKITVLSIGKRVSNAVMFKALAAGADELLRVEDPAFESGKLDSFLTAKAISQAIKKIGNFDLILVGRQAADWNSGQTGIYVAGNLGIPCITLAQKVTVKSNSALVERLRTNGYEVVKTGLPAVIMVSNEVGELRYHAMKERREAKKK